MMYSAVLLLYAILKQRDGVPKIGKGAEGHGARERLLTIHLMKLLRKDGKYATKLGLEPSIKVRVLAEKNIVGEPMGRKGRANEIRGRF